MAKTQVQNGDRMLITAGAAYDSGDPVVVGGTDDAQIGIAAVDIASGATGQLIMTGVHDVPKVSGAVIAQGESVQWDASASAFDDNQATAASGDVAGACTAWEAAGNGVTTIAVKLNTGKGTITA